MTVQLAFAAMLAPLNCTVVLAFVAETDPLHVVVIACEVTTVMPLGRLSAKPTPVNATAPAAVLLIVICRTEVPPPAIDAGVKLFATVTFGATATVVETLVQWSTGAQDAPAVGGEVRLSPPPPTEA